MVLLWHHCEETFKQKKMQNKTKNKTNVLEMIMRKMFFWQEEAPLRSFFQKCVSPQPYPFICGHRYEHWQLRDRESRSALEYFHQFRGYALMNSLLLSTQWPRQAARCSAERKTYKLNDILKDRPRASSSNSRHMKNTLQYWSIQTFWLRIFGVFHTQDCGTCRECYHNEC